MWWVTSTKVLHYRTLFSQFVLYWEARSSRNESSPEIKSTLEFFYPMNSRAVALLHLKWGHTEVESDHTTNSPTFS